MKEGLMTDLPTLAGFHVRKRVYNTALVTALASQHSERLVESKTQILELNVIFSVSVNRFPFVT